MKIVIGEMRPEHLAQVAAIEKESFTTPWSREAFDYELTQNDFAIYLVALNGEQVAGYAGLWLILDEAHVTNVAVHAAFRGRGLGMMLMLELMRRAALAGAARMTLEVRASNHTARRLYERLGFKERGRRRGYYTDTNEDALIMWHDQLFPWEGGEVT
ncbi:ribosomal protein S18-alanine N-acetyltransferase [Desulfotomaculum copahuensis]|uniref:Ribosomal-protein-alanine N-acetyltransferase n=1 Tax=Desulfotomaculum copahuensis TaxID=1838280 RepID=A0A1B7LBV4_9FIRM|nr:ribosomal protein S18-alanine N-acetyltransferase [Desulfotomaculum copahuensis]OAT79958.1 ribosomal-protein-alanine N-acetyltransferase [Desulfotomaculum copahuensis]